VALLGAGGIGRMHAQRLFVHPDLCLAGVADPSPAARDWAEGLGVPWAAEPADLLDRVRPGAAIVSTPNALHTSVGLECVARRIPLLVENRLPTPWPRPAALPTLREPPVCRCWWVTSAGMAWPCSARAG
jgi:hypothetical protein